MILTVGSFVLAGLGLLVTWLLGRKRRVGFMINLAIQVLWVPYDVITRQYGFLLFTITGVPICISSWLKWKGPTMSELRNEIPGWNGSQGPGPGQYGKPHVYARDIQSGAGNCVCGRDLVNWIHVQAAPGIPIPDSMRRPR